MQLVEHGLRGGRRPRLGAAVVVSGALADVAPAVVTTK
jgi:hypothetical protein